METQKVLDQLASTHVGNGSKDNALYFALKKGMIVVAVFTKECLDDAMIWAYRHDYFLEGPEGVVVEPSWSYDSEEEKGDGWV